MKMINISKLYFSVLLLVFSVIILPFCNFFSQELFLFETSVWCFTGSNQENICKFKNICYDSQFKTFLFFLGKDSVVKGFKNYSELQKIQLSSVQQHNYFYANISVVDIRNYKILKKAKINSQALLLSRFKPNNLMHIIHDDLLPIFLRLESTCLGDMQCIENYGLVLHDNHPKGSLFSLYKLFSKHSPILLNELTMDLNTNLCFKELLTGLVLDGVVYQYGFKKPHGPLKPSHLTQNDILRFTLFLKNKLQIYNETSNTSKIVLFERKKNRKILNIKKVQEMIKNAYQRLSKKIEVNLINLDLVSNDFKTLLKVISEADGLIGMHGGEMIFSLFLKPNTYVLEIFPFGIKPEVVSFIKPISELDGSNFMHFSWRNILKNNSFGYPTAHPLYGGISNLDEMTQEIIENTTEVPPVECCNNPLFLYHMYQDTLISNEFESFLYKSLNKIKKSNGNSESEQIIKKWFHPYIVFNVSCIFQFHRRLLHIEWEPPFNVKTNENLIYSLYVKDQKNLFNKEISTKKLILQIETPVGVGPKFKVWISVYLNKNRSPDLFVNC